MIEKALLLTSLAGINPATQTSIHQVDVADESNITQENSCYSKEEIQSIVITTITDVLAIRSDTITLRSDFIKDLGADSLDIVELIMELEEKFTIIIPDDIAESVSNVGEAIDFIHNQYKHAVLLFSEANFMGNSRCILDKITENDAPSKSNSIIDGGLSSLVIPPGYTVTLYTDRNFKGESAKIVATEFRIGLKDLSKLKKHKNIELSDKRVKWNDNIRSIKVDKSA